MIPLRDDNETTRFPMALLVLMAVNIAVFCYELSLDTEVERALHVFGMGPAYVLGHAKLEGVSSFWWPWGTLLTSAFFHIGWMHLIGNMYFFWMFGDNIEDYLGSKQFLACYLLSALAGGFACLLTNPHSTDPHVGASGAISGLLGLYLVLYPRAKISILVYVRVVKVSAVLFLGLWFLVQFNNGLMSLGMANGNYDGVGWWAHLGGFLFGVGYGLWCRRGEPWMEVATMNVD